VIVYYKVYLTSSEYNKMQRKIDKICDEEWTALDTPVSALLYLATKLTTLLYRELSADLQHKMKNKTKQDKKV